MGQGEGEGGSRSGARVADDSSVSSKRPGGFLGVGGGVGWEQSLFKLGELRFVLRSPSTQTGRILMFNMTAQKGIHRESPGVRGM